MDYKNISRRGLIQLNQDYDAEHSDSLHEYLEEKGEDTYEGIRPAEVMLEKYDQVTDSAKASGKVIKKALLKCVGNNIDYAIQAIDELADELAKAEAANTAETIEVE